MHVSLYAQKGKTTKELNEYNARYGKAISITNNGAGGINARVVDGNSVVFEYRFQSAQQEDVSDDEIVEFYTFAFTPDKTGKFTLNTEALAASNGYYNRNCFCMDRGTHRITGGSISGVRMTKTTWLIRGTLEITIKQSEGEKTITKKINATYKIKK